jgi:GNAT superfamily N-acetyltransferase
MKLAWRLARPEDARALALLNRQLIEDERHDNRMTVDELAERLGGRIADDEYRVVLFLDEDSLVAFATLHLEGRLAYLLQFFVERARRRQGVGRRAIEILFSEIIPADRRTVVECMVWNEAGLAFWREQGFQDRYVGLSRPLLSA